MIFLYWHFIFNIIDAKKWIIYNNTYIEIIYEAVKCVRLVTVTNTHTPAGGPWIVLHKTLISLTTGLNRDSSLLDLEPELQICCITADEWAKQWLRAEEHEAQRAARDVREKYLTFLQSSVGFGFMPGTIRLWMMFSVFWFLQYCSSSFYKQGFK